MKVGVSYYRVFRNCVKGAAGFSSQGHHRCCVAPVCSAPLGVTFLCYSCVLAACDDMYQCHRNFIIFLFFFFLFHCFSFLFYFYFPSAASVISQGSTTSTAPKFSVSIAIPGEQRVIFLIIFTKEAKMSCRFFS